ncbi:flavodoxin [Methylobacterium sp. NEAU K]|uniref:flavodoxin family protein n=1 Tax=Methylobacterium sp. NEAU K TaxID=3064946 RepID=UPI0027353C2F|nr:flavodoxin [Methylobacterium sp. NEAU K]MDP4006621.1 flavodoxin [Methylobacterium sp. NEAU K]
MSDVLVAYYSCSGTTEKVAHALADRLGAELDRITSPVPYTGATGFMRGIWHSLRSVTPPIQHHLEPMRFQIVVLCSPVWGGKLAAPMRTYLRQAGKIPSLCGVAVSGVGGQQARFFREMEYLGSQADIPALSLTQRQVVSGAYERSVDIFVEMLHSSLIEAA